MTWRIRKLGGKPYALQRHGRVHDAAFVRASDHELVLSCGDYWLSAPVDVVAELLRLSGYDVKQRPKPAPDLGLCSKCGRPMSGPACER